MTASRPPSISAVLPAYNEVGCIADVVRRTHDALTAAGLLAFEVIVVDDGSGDGTADAVRAVAGSRGGVRLLGHERNLGYGRALRTGFDAATCDAVWLLDSDAQFDPADLPRLLDVFADDAFVAGYRLERRDGMVRRLNHRAFFGLVRLLLGPTLRDVNCAFKLFPRWIGTGLTSDGAVVSTELVLRARRCGLRVVEVPVPHHPRTTGSATGARPGVVLRAFRELPSLRRRVAAWEPPVSRSPRPVPPS